MIRASSLERVSLCPGSYNAEQGLPDRENEYSNHGDLVHFLVGAIEGNEIDGISAIPKDAFEDAKACLERAEALEAKLGISGPIYREQEINLWSDESKDAIIIMQGHPDRVTVGSHSLLIIDYKTGHGDVDPASENIQLRAYAVMVADLFSHFGVDEVFTCIIKPWSTGEVCRYSREDLAQARKEIVETIQGAIVGENVSDQAGSPVLYYQPNRKPSEKACKYCKACGTARCPESIKTLDIPPIRGPQSLDDIASLLESVQKAKIVIKAIEENARKQLESGNPIPGWMLRPDPKRTPRINDAWAACASRDITPEAFQSKCSISIKSMEELLASEDKKQIKTIVDSISDVSTSSKMVRTK